MWQENQGFFLFPLPFPPFFSLTITTNDYSGEMKCFPVVETRQNNNICELVVAPPSFPFPASAEKTALSVARSFPLPPFPLLSLFFSLISQHTPNSKAVSALDGVGIFGVEMFWMKDGRILVNEIAPRPHNSGHYTIEVNCCCCCCFTI